MAKAVDTAQGVINTSLKLNVFTDFSSSAESRIDFKRNFNASFGGILGNVGFGAERVLDCEGHRPLYDFYQFMITTSF